jgi:hypothetical protein
VDLILAWTIGGAVWLACMALAYIHFRDQGKTVVWALLYALVWPNAILVEVFGSKRSRGTSRDRRR